jgi:hypothetical protein
MASLCGGTVHGFYLDEQAPAGEILWLATLLAMGVTALAAWAIGAKLIFSSRVSSWVLGAAAVQFAAFGLAVLSWSQKFAIALVNNLPAVVFLLFALCLAYRSKRERKLLIAALGVALALLAGLLQQLGVGLHPVYFNHNALYHVVQAIALLLFFLGGSRLVCNSPP